MWMIPQSLVKRQYLVSFNLTKYKTIKFNVFTRFNVYPSCTTLTFTFHHDTPHVEWQFTHENENKVNSDHLSY